MIINSFIFAPALTTITISAIEGVTAPERNTYQDTTVTETAQWTASISWSPNDDPYQSSTIYTATITITPKTGYTLTGVSANFFTLTGATSVTNSANSGVVTAAFPVTAEAYKTYQMTDTDTQAVIVPSFTYTAMHESKPSFAGMVGGEFPKVMYWTASGGDGLGWYVADDTDGTNRMNYISSSADLPPEQAWNSYTISEVV